MSRRFQIELGSTRATFEGDSETRVLGVIGHPVQHSLSPRFQRVALEILGINAVYLAFDVAPEELHQCLLRARRLAHEGRLVGLNVTLPHKEAVVQELDQLDDEARLVGAVNTLRFDKALRADTGDVCLQGSNTDVLGLISALQGLNVCIRDSPVVVVGAGGAARAAVVAALKCGASEIRLVNRTLPRAQELLDGISAAWPGRLPRLVCVPLATPGPGLLDAALLVQTTSLGLSHEDESPLSLQAAPQHLFVLDLIYSPPETALLRAARRRGLRAANGLTMLVHQGAASLRQWLQVEPPLGAMLASVGLQADDA